MPIYYKNTPAKKIACLFSAVPRTGTTTLDQIFLDHQFLRFYGEESSILGTRQKCPAQHFDREILEAIFNFDRIDFKFQIVRHPVDRLISAYWYANRKKKEKSPFNFWWSQASTKLSENPRAYDNHLLPQHCFEICGTAIYRFEEGILQITRDVFNQIGQPFKRRNIGKKNEKPGAVVPRKLISRDSWAAIERVYKEDFERYNYELE